MRRGRGLARVSTEHNNPKIPGLIRATFFVDADASA